jgi:hypothetical protein
VNDEIVGVKENVVKAIPVISSNVKLNERRRKKGWEGLI